MAEELTYSTRSFHSNKKRKSSENDDMIFITSNVYRVYLSDIEEPVQYESQPWTISGKTRNNIIC